MINFFEQEDKYFFAGLFNTAVNNFDLSLLELAKRTGKPYGGDSKNKSLATLENAFNKDRIPQKDLDNNFKFLGESLVFINKIPAFIEKLNKGKEKSEKIILKNFLQDFLKKLYTTLESYRNYYTHYHHKEIEIDETIADFLNYILFNSTNRIKDDRVKLKDARKRILTNFQEDIKTIIEKKNDWVSIKNQEFKEQNVRTRYEFFHFDNKGKNFAINELFRNYFIDDSTKQPVLRPISVCNEEKKLTRSGLIQLLALFLSKRQINLLFENVNYTLKETDTQLQKLVARWIYTYESYKPIKKLFKSDYTNDALLLQMVSEISKCPKELYHLLDQKHQEEFIEDINIYLQENTSKLGNTAIISHEVIQKRYQDKFPYFAIRFLDEIVQFPNLRFHVNLGKFNHNTEYKFFKSLEQETERSILERITIFERLSVATQKKKEYFINNQNLTEEDWQEFPNPSYNFFGNNIGIAFINNTENKYITPEDRGKNKKTKQDIVKKLKLSEDNLKKPVAYLSFNELPALLYNLLVKGQSKEEIEKQIRDKIKAQYKYISNNEVNKQHKKLRTYNDNEGKEYNIYRIKSKLRAEIAVNPLDEIRKNYKTKPKNENTLSLSEKGKIATWLSDDIKRFTPKEIKEDWKGYQFAQFQTLLSYYEYERRNVQKYLSTDLLLDVKKQFPFKGFDFSRNSLLHFYKNYLNNRKQYLKQLLAEVNKGNIAIDKLPFHRNIFKIKTKKEYQQTLRNHPFMLPRGVFDATPTFNKEDKYAKPDWYKVSMDIEKAQEFYKYDKHYEITDTNTLTLKVNKGLKEQFNTSVSKSKKREIYKNERILLKTMQRDFYLLEMIKYVFKNSNEVDNEIFNKLSLKDFYLTKAEKQKIIEKSKSQSIRQEGDKSENIYNESYILSKKIEIKLFDGKLKGNVALKDSSKYKKLEQDIKIKQIISYDLKDKWTFEEIFNELSDYEHVRSKQLFAEIHQLEKKIYQKAEKAGMLSELENEGNPNFNKYMSYYFLNDEQKEVLNGIDVKITKTKDVREDLQNIFLLILIRNKFAHNQLLAKEDFDFLNKRYPIYENERVATYVFRVYKNIINKIDKI